MKLHVKTLLLMIASYELLCRTIFAFTHSYENGQSRNTNFHIGKSGFPKQIYNLGQKMLTPSSSVRSYAVTELPTLDSTRKKATLSPNYYLENNNSNGKIKKRFNPTNYGTYDGYTEENSKELNDYVNSNDENIDSTYIMQPQFSQNQDTNNNNNYNSNDGGFVPISTTKSQKKNKEIFSANEFLNMNQMYRFQQYQQPTPVINYGTQQYNLQQYNPEELKDQKSSQMDKTSNQEEYRYPNYNQETTVFDYSPSLLENGMTEAFMKNQTYYGSVNPFAAQVSEQYFDDKIKVSNVECPTPFENDIKLPYKNQVQQEPHKQNHFDKFKLPSVMEQYRMLLNGENNDSSLSDINSGINKREGHRQQQGNYHEQRQSSLLPKTNLVYSINSFIPYYEKNINKNNYGTAASQTSYYQPKEISISSSSVPHLSQSSFGTNSNELIQHQPSSLNYYQPYPNAFNQNYPYSSQLPLSLSSDETNIRTAKLANQIKNIVTTSVEETPIASAPDNNFNPSLYQRQHYTLNSPNFISSIPSNSPYHEQPVLAKHIDIIKTKHIPIPIYKQIHIPYKQPLKIQIPKPVIMTITKPMPIQVPVTKTVTVPVQKELKIPVERLIPLMIEKRIPYKIEKQVPYPVEKHIKIPIYKPFPVRIPIIKTVFHKAQNYHLPPSSSSLSSQYHHQSSI